VPTIIDKMEVNKNFNLIIIGVNVIDFEKCKEYDDICKRTKEGFFVNLKT
jgi:hypothetical protein